MRISKKGMVSFLVLTVILVLSFAHTALAGDIVLNDLESKSVNLSSLAGKPAILFFWTTSCPYCLGELRDLNKMYPQMEKEGIAVFIVNVGDPGYRVKRFLKDHKLDIRVFLDEDGRAAEYYEIRGVPTYIFIDKDAQVVSTEHRLSADYKSLLLK